MTRRYRHIGWADEVGTARDDGSTARVLCGRRVHPLPADVLDPMPTCPTCATKRDLAYSERQASFCWTASPSGFFKVTADLGWVS